MKRPRLTCSVPDCDLPSVVDVNISINNLPKRKLPVCKMHADAALEDVPTESCCIRQTPMRRYQS